MGVSSGIGIFAARLDGAREAFDEFPIHLEQLRAWPLTWNLVTRLRLGRLEISRPAGVVRSGHLLAMMKQGATGQRAASRRPRAVKRESGAGCPLRAAP
jgi:hypothetical protein